MKIEEIIPELRRGRRARRTGYQSGTQKFPFVSLKDIVSNLESLMDADWELEPFGAGETQFRRFVREDLSNRGFIRTSYTNAEKQGQYQETWANAKDIIVISWGGQSREFKKPTGHEICASGTGGWFVSCIDGVLSLKLDGTWEWSPR